jgi:tetratricopeptide (TPR) repeat protein
MSTLLYADASVLEQHAQSAWQERDKPGETEIAIKLWQQAVIVEPGRGDLWTTLAKAMGRAERHAKSNKERRQWADRAWEAAQNAVMKDPKSSDAYAAYGEALGQWANVHKGIHSLKAVREAVDALKHAIELNPKNAYAHMLLASFYREAPGVISVGDKAKAYEEAKLAVLYGPGYAINHLVLARVELDRGEKDEAIKELQLIIALPPPADAVPETRADQDSAQKQLQELGVTPACGQEGGFCSEQEHS